MIALLAGCGQMLWADIGAPDTFVWRNTDDRFGGLSGIDMADDGLSLTAISDRAKFVTADVQRGPNGAITALSNVVIHPLRDTRGRGPDSEGLAIGDRIYVSVEGRHQVLAFDAITGRSTALPQHPDFKGMQSNSSLEALAIDATGALYTLPERSGWASRPLPVYRYRDGVWDIAFRIPRRGNFLTSGADIGPDGRFYLLDRHFTGTGFQTRVRRFNIDGTHEVTVIETSNRTHDNLEGISVWQSPNGLRMTLVSDDDFRFFQRTELVEYAIND
jgi:hypothetical protein